MFLLADNVQANPACSKIYFYHKKVLAGDKNTSVLKQYWSTVCTHIWKQKLVSMYTPTLKQLCPWCQVCKKEKIVKATTINTINIHKNNIRMLYGLPQTAQEQSRWKQQAKVTKIWFCFFFSFPLRGLYQNHLSEDNQLFIFAVIWFNSYCAILHCATWVRQLNNTIKNSLENFDHILPEARAFVFIHLPQRHYKYLKQGKKISHFPCEFLQTWDSYLISKRELRVNT